MPRTFLQLIRDDPEWAERRLRELRQVLSDLYDEQNGPPLIRREKEWEAAMKKAREALGYSSIP